MIASALVFLMIPSLSLIYAGLGNRSFALTLFRLPVVTAAFIGLQWVFWGYALAFTDSGFWWGGEKRANALQDVLARPISTGDSPGGSPIPELVYVVYEGMFACFTAAVVCGGTMHRARPARFIVFITLWSLLVYIPIARWSWSPYGWSRLYGTLDFAGGTPVHIVSGTTVAAFAMFCSVESKASLGEFISIATGRAWRRTVYFWKNVWSALSTVIRIIVKIIAWIITCGNVRLRRPNEPEDEPEDEPPGIHDVDDTSAVFQPYNVNYIVLGTALLWFGWAGFNGGSALGANLRAVSAWASTHFAACAGGVTGMFWIWLYKAMPDDNASDAGSQQSGEGSGASRRRHADRRRTFDDLSAVYFCDGAISGLVAITPAAGYVPVWSAPIFGIVSAILVNLLKNETRIYLRHDPLQVFAVHAGGGLVGMGLTAFFADPVTIGLDGHSTIPHPEYTMGKRFGFQLVDGLSGMCYTFVMSLAILYFMKLVASIFMSTPWKQIAVYDDENRLEDEFQATISQQWRSDLDPLGRIHASPVQRERQRPVAIPMRPIHGSQTQSPGSSPKLTPVGSEQHGYYA
ncbi:ammonium transporter AmtB-like domain-containing protein [Bombardia bombarda]|uniref:Ammonium transporter AmtB-like domain-containing protein n=1 Tax=Bombardia bombarda TaxID=252184 RepID=A0AA39XBI5_9PEZI|nr:ammonium transporter AmtB-like domain-containing protein [Bombardia bombarda]